MIHHVVQGTVCAAKPNQDEDEGVLHEKAEMQMNTPLAEQAEQEDRSEEERSTDVRRGTDPKDNPALRTSVIRKVAQT